jgi:hypothetical protein
MMPGIVFFSTTSGLLTGIYANGINKNNKNENDRIINVYTNLIGYTSLGLITGITYPISFPLFTYYTLKQDRIFVKKND